MIFLSNLEGIAVRFLEMVKNKVSLSIIEDLWAKERKIRWIEQKVCVQPYSLGKYKIWNIMQFNLTLLAICLVDKFDIYFNNNYLSYLFKSIIC